MSRPSARPWARPDRRALAAAAAAVTVVTAGVAGAATAGAATSRASAVVVSGGVELEYRAAPGQVNDVRVTSVWLDEFTVRYTVDDVVPISAGAGCSRPDPADATRVTCDADATPTDGGPNVEVWLGDRDDRLLLDATGLGYAGDSNGAVGHGGPGNDRLTGGRYTTWLWGNGDRDVLRGGTANDHLFGGSGPDTLYGGTSGDLLRGGPGPDVLWGNSSNDRLFGDDGDDRLYGGPGRDTLDGGPGRDVLRQD